MNKRNKRRKINIGLIGYGQHGKWAALPSLRAASNVKLKCVADLSADNLVLITDPKVSTYTDYRRMIEQEELDAVYIATPQNTHAAIAVNALKAGLHVITEKPMASSAAECKRMCNAARKAGRLLVVDFETRYEKPYMQIRKWITEGRLGKLGAIHIDHLWDCHKATGRLAERRRRFCNVAGTLDCGIHKLDLARYFNGGGEWRNIRAYGAWFGEDVRFPPHIAIQARLDTGVLFTLNSSFSFTAYIPQRIPSSNYDSMSILGDKGVVVLHQEPDGARSLQIVSETLSEVVPFVGHGGKTGVVSLLNDFASSILTGRPLPPEAATGHDGLMAQLIVGEANRDAVEAGDSNTPKKGH